MPTTEELKPNMVLQNKQQIAVNPEVVAYAYLFGKKEAYLYNNRLLRGIINPTELDKSQYNVNWEYINSLQNQTPIPW
jgi:hypothetical protein